MQIATFGHTLIQNVLSSIADHKILLENSQQMAILIAVIRIQKQGEILLDIFFIKRNTICHNAFIYRINIKQMKLIGTVSIACHCNIIQTGMNS